MCKWWKPEIKEPPQNVDLLILEKGQGTTFFGTFEKYPGKDSAELKNHWYVFDNNDWEETDIVEYWMLVPRRPNV